jgi:riboflavin synthase
MFTGIITATTPITNTQQLKDGLKLTLQIPEGWDDLVLGESIAVNGACLTVAALRPTEYEVILMPETLSKTTFSHRVPSVVNLERALVVGDRLSGHIVQGHIDDIGQVIRVSAAKGYELTIKFPIAQHQLVIHKGSITVDGVSLTVASCQTDRLSVAIIPHTLAHTTLGSLREYDEVNLEFDIIGKYATKTIEQDNNATS